MLSQTSTIEIGGFSVSGAKFCADEPALSARISAAYLKAVETPLGSDHSMWLTGPLFELKKRVHEILASNDLNKLENLLSDPGESDLLYGFEDNAISLRLPADEPRIQGLVAMKREQLALLAEALGAVPVRKAGSVFQHPVSIEETLERLDDLFGFRIEFPNPFPGEEGLETGRGILTYRATQALYQAYRIRELTKGVANPRVLEIGAGSGRTAFYAWQLGIRDYTIVDLPLTCVASANFLGRTIGADALSLYGEPEGRGIKIIPPEEFYNRQDKYDLAINVDSITEMAWDTASSYFAEIDKRAAAFLSINHEGNEFRARDLFGSQCISRHPYWMRDSYVEEVVKTTRGSR